MKRFTNTLAVLCLIVGFTSINAHAGLMIENLSQGYQIDENGFTVYQPNSNPIITSNSVIKQYESADISWLVDTTGLQSIAFNFKLLGSDSNLGLASLFFGEQTLWSQAQTVTSLTEVTIDLSQIDFSSFSSNMLDLRFMLQANNFSSPFVRVGRDKSSLQLSNIRLTRVEVPEPSSIILFLLAMTLLIRRKLAK